MVRQVGECSWLWFTWQLILANLKLLLVVYWRWTNSQCYGWTTHGGEIRHLCVWKGGLTTSRQELQLLHHHLSYCRSFWYVRQQQRSLSAAHGHQLYLLPLSMKGTQAGEGVEGCSLWFNPKKGGWTRSARWSLWKSWIIKFWFAFWLIRGSNLRGWGWRGMNIESHPKRFYQCWWRHFSAVAIFCRCL